MVKRIFQITACLGINLSDMACNLQKKVIPKATDSMKQFTLI